MATQARTIATFGDAGEGSVVVHWDDVTLLFLDLTVDNPTANSVFVQITDATSGRSYSQTFGNGTTVLPIPQGVNTQLAIEGVYPNGKWRNIQFVISYPV